MNWGGGNLGEGLERDTGKGCKGLARQWKEGRDGGGEVTHLALFVAEVCFVNQSKGGNVAFFRSHTHTQVP